MDGYLIFITIVLSFIFITSFIACVKLAKLMCKFWEKEDIDMKGYHELEEINSVSGVVCDSEFP